MKTYKVTMNVMSTISGNVDSQTLFGAICWAIRDLYGSERLENLLENFFHSDDSFIVSSLFPKGLYPKPVFNWTNYETIKELKEIPYNLTYPINKKLNKIKYISEEILIKFLNDKLNISEIIIDLALSKGDFAIKNGVLYKSGENLNLPQVETVNDMRNSLNRMTNSTEEGNLFYHRRIYIEKGAEFNFFVRTNNLSMIESALKYLSDSAFLGDKSIGMNVYNFSNIKEIDNRLFQSKLEKSYLLSKFIPKDEDVDWSKNNSYNLIKMNYRVESRNEFLTEDNIKKQVIYLTEGSLLHLNNKEKINGDLPVIKTIGNKKIYQNGIGFFI